MEITNSKQWLCIHNWVYASIQLGAVLLYNTRNGQFITTTNPKHLDLINHLHKRENLGAVLIDVDVSQDSETKCFIEEAIQKEIFSLIPFRENQAKPIQLMPVLNIQRDVEKLKKDPDRSLGENIIYYLTELTIFVNSQCSLQCDFCRKATRQFPCCTSRNDDSSLSIAILQSIAKQIQIIPGITLNIFGGNIFQYPELQQLPNLFPEKNIRYWFHYSNYQNTTIESIAQFNILIDFPVKRANLFSCIDQLPKEKTKLHFIVSSVEDVESAQSIINERSIEKIELHPLYSEDSKLFFEENVFLNQDDITSETISQRKIFCNQTLNANFFGKLTILPNGDVCANPNSEKLGSMQEDTILKLIYKELDTNTAWRKIRTEKPCNKCLYQYLCPPPSNYEYVIGRPNLCHL